MTETEIVAGCCRNDRRCQEALFRRFFPTMLAVCLRHTPDRQKATEIVNNGFLKVFKKIDSFRAEGSLEGWVRRIVVHSISDYFRIKVTAHEWLENNYNGQLSLPPSVMSELYAEDIIQLTEQLPPATRKVFQQFVLEGWSHEEIAKSADISVGTSKWHLSNARKMLQHLIQKNYPNGSYA